ncbi:hypothetical protein ACQEVS_10915 [Streptomyces sp. CA-181903]|uniref:hypothetical protein n=1 Tax=Streptomyces sp. CA-181903 TaxID=3240055 RepID=UPI003D928902
MNLLPRPRSRRLADPAPPAPVRCTLQAACDREVENKVRALCVLAFAGTGTRLNSLHIIEPDDDVVVQVGLVLDGSDTAALERLVVRLTREPRVRDVRWHLHTGVPSSRGEAP